MAELCQTVNKEGCSLLNTARQTLINSCVAELSRRHSSITAGIIVLKVAADISAFVDIPTRHSCEKYLLAIIGQLQLTDVK